MTNFSSGMGRAAKRRPSPVSIRLSDDQRAELLRQAGSRPLGSYIKGVLFDPQATSRRASPAGTPMDRAALARVLSLLGQSQLAVNLAALAKAAEVGNLYVEDGTRRQLEGACTDVAAMRAALMDALGKRMPAEEPPSTASAFAASANPYDVRPPRSEGGRP